MERAQGSGNAPTSGDREDHRPGGLERSAPATPGSGGVHTAVLGLQRLAGNAAVRDLLLGPRVAPPRVVQRCADPTGLVHLPPVAALQRDFEERVAQRVGDDGSPEPADAATPTGAGAGADGGGAGGGGGTKPAFDHSGGTVVTLSADTAVEFANKITATIGTPHVNPVFTPDIAFSLKKNAKGEDVPDKITSIGLHVSTAITKVRYGGGRADAENRRAINEMVTAISAHELAHRAIIEAAATEALQAVQKLVGTGKTADAQKALTTDLECAANKGHEALDAKEGKITATESRDADGKVTVTVVKSSGGTKYPCP